MAHLIVQNMMAWKEEKPWHGLGVEVNPEATGREMLVAAKMDWKVQRRALAMRGADGQGLLADPLKGFRAIVRADTDQVFQIATTRYNPVQNEEIVDFFKDFCDAGHARLETIGAISGGEKIWALAKLNGETEVEIGKGDTVTGYLLMATSHDGSLRTIAKATQTRVVCWNTLQTALSEDSTREFKMKHSKKFTEEVKQQAQQVMGMAVEQIQEVNQFAKALSHVTVDQKGRLQFVLQLMQGKGVLEQMADSEDMSNLDKIISHEEFDADKAMGRVGRAILEAITSSPGSELPSAKDTLWGCLNGVTYYTDHQAGRSQDTRLSNAWFGTGEQMKADAIEVCKDMAGIPSFA